MRTYSHTLTHTLRETLMEPTNLGETFHASDLKICLLTHSSLLRCYFRMSYWLNLAQVIFPRILEAHFSKVSTFLRSDFSE